MEIPCSEFQAWRDRSICASCRPEYVPRGVAYDAPHRWSDNHLVHAPASAPGPHTATSPYSDCHIESCSECEITQKKKKIELLIVCFKCVRHQLTDERSLCECDSRIMATSLRRAPQRRILERLQASADSVDIIFTQCRHSLSDSGLAILTAISSSQAATIESAVLSI